MTKLQETTLVCHRRGLRRRAPFTMTYTAAMTSYMYTGPGIMF